MTAMTDHRCQPGCPRCPQPEHLLGLSAGTLGQCRVHKAPGDRNKLRAGSVCNLLIDCAPPFSLTHFLCFLGLYVAFACIASFTACLSCHLICSEVGVITTLSPHPNYQGVLSLLPPKQSPTRYFPHPPHPHPGAHHHRLSPNCWRGFGCEPKGPTA